MNELFFGGEVVAEISDPPAYDSTTLAARLVICAENIATTRAGASVLESAALYEREQESHDCAGNNDSAVIVDRRANQADHCTAGQTEIAKHDDTAFANAKDRSPLIRRGRRLMDAAVLSYGNVQSAGIEA